MKKYVSILMALVLMVMLCGCSKDQEVENPVPVNTPERDEAEMVVSADTRPEKTGPQIVKGAEYVQAKEGVSWGTEVWYLPMTDGTVAVDCYSSGYSMTVPEQVDGYTVSTLITTEDPMNNSLKSLTIPDGVVRILSGRSISGLDEIILSPTHPTMKIENGLLMSKDGKELLAVIDAGWKREFVIPDGVERIGDEAFYGEKGISSIVFPESVRSIGDKAFNACNGLWSITIPNTVTKVGANPFVGCYQFREIQVASDHPTLKVTNGILYSKDGTRLICRPAVVTQSSYILSTVREIGDYAFYDCYMLKSVPVPYGVKSIGEYAFGNCTKLEKVTIPESVVSIGDGAFAYCQLLKEVRLPERMDDMGEGVFTWCRALESISLPDGITRIGDEMFTVCTQLTELTIPESVTSIGHSAFYCCTGLTSLTIPKGVTQIGDLAFAECELLERVTVYEGSYAHQYCVEQNIPYVLAE